VVHGAPTAPELQDPVLVRHDRQDIRL